MSGHETEDERRDIATREATLDRTTSTVDDLLELALLYLEPAHREDEAIELLESLVSREPEHGTARLWLAYALLHFGMDAPSLARAEAALARLLDSESHSGAAHLLLAEVREEQGASVDERIQLLETSVAREPSWVSNRDDLAAAYTEVGRRGEALEQLRAALAVVTTADPTWGVARRMYEESITGRTAFGAEDRLRAGLDDPA